MNESLFQERLSLVEDAVKLREPSRVPVVPMVSALPYFLYGGTYRDSMYDYERATKCVLAYFDEFQPDAIGFSSSQFTSGKANELAGTAIIDWPGRPGTKVPDWSTHQIHDREFMTREEYPELLRDFTGFTLRKYIPRMYPNIEGLGNIWFTPFSVMNTKPLGSFYSQPARSAWQLLSEIGEEDAKAAQATARLQAMLRERAFPPMYNAGGQAPFDILSDYYRGTMGMLYDQMECPELIQEACDMFADMMIEHYRRIDFSGSPVRRVLFPLHKGMDGFMDEEQYAELYWAPLKRIMMALIEMDVTPFIYTEGPYNSRLEQLCDVPVGKVIYHFETVDMARAKKLLGGIACISGNLPISLLQYGSPDQVRDETRRLLDICAPGGGYIFDTNAFVDNATRENWEAMVETIDLYGKA